MNVATVLNTAASILIEQASHLLDEENADAAATQLDQAAQRLTLTGHPYLPLFLAVQRVRLEIARRNLADAATLAEAGIESGVQILATADAGAQVAVRSGMARLQALAGAIAEQRGQPQAADNAFMEALALLGPDPGPLGAEIEISYAELLSARGDHIGANRHYQAATQYSRRR